MELAVNQFTKGLQVDTNPMVQGDDTLSDALNATFVTMNGNEVILLNDMGNRRVDHAFLPAGYEPVGIKEYGGVIYVASYNPITNRSQIGSFPSPERILSSLDNPDLGIDSYAFSRFFKEANIENIGGIKFLKNDEFMDLLTADTSLHAGDKFSIYSNYIWGKQDYISHFNNWEEQKLISPKNKLFTLSVGVMNSLNEFVDITESLERFNEDNELIKIENDAQKLDDGYFIAPAKPTTRKEDIDIERNLLAVNTYSYKLVGPLQLKTTLNHILNFDFVMDWQKGSEENLYILIIRGIATYNCPDVLITNKLTEIETEGDSEIIVEGEVEIEDSDPTIPSERKEYAKRARFDILLNTLLTIEKAFESFDVYIKNSTKLKWIKLENTPDNPNIKTILPDIKTTYDINTDLYTSTITKKYIFTKSEAYENILLYYICVKALAEPYEEEGEEYNNIYLKNLSYQGEIDLTKIGSNIVELKEYRYLYEPLDTDKGLATMTFFTEAYPDHFTEFSDFKILLELLVSNGGNSSWKPIDPDSYLYEAGTVLSGRVTFSFPTTLAQTLYRVKFSYNKKSTIEESQEEHIIYRYLLTTELFNDCYYGSSEDYVEDYGLFMGTISEGSAPYTITYNGQPILTEVSEDLKKIRDNYLEVKLKALGKITNNSTENNTNDSKYISSTTNDDLYANIKYIENINIKYEYQAAINDDLKYPEYINLSNPSDITITKPDENLVFKSTEMNYIENIGYNSTELIIKEQDNTNRPYLYEGIQDENWTNNNTYTGIFKYYDRFRSKSTEKNVRYGTVYVKLTDPIMRKKLFSPYYFGFQTTSHGEASHNWHTYCGMLSLIKTEEHYDKSVDSSEYNRDSGPLGVSHGNLGFLDDPNDSNYRMKTALNKVESQAETYGVNFLYMFTNVTEPLTDTDYHPYPANDELYYKESLFNSPIKEYPYFLDLYTVVFVRAHLTGLLYLLGDVPFKYRNLWNYWKNDTSKTVLKIVEESNSGKNRSLEGRENSRQYDTEHPNQPATRNNPEILESDFKDSILEFIGKHGLTPNIDYYVVPINNYFGDQKYFPDSSKYLYNNPYQLTFTLDPTDVLYNGDLNTIPENLSNLLGFTLKNKHFNTESFSITKYSTKDFNIKCYDIINKDDINGIFLDTGEEVPFPEDPTLIYVWREPSCQLKVVHKPPFIYSDENGMIVFYKLENCENSELILTSYRNNLRRASNDGSSGRTLIPFKLIRVITKEMLKYHDGD